MSTGLPWGGQERVGSLQVRDRTIQWPRRPLIMGIVNINPDSFSGDGTLDVDEALRKAAAMVRHGADIIDVGGESAGTQRQAVAEQEEIRRLIPFVERFRSPEFRAELQPADDRQLFPPLLSINTWRPVVAEEVLGCGGDILNDIGGLNEDDNARICQRFGAALVIMHIVGLPKIAHRHTQYRDVMSALKDFFRERVERAAAAGLASEQIILDPGIDFAKQKEDNLRIYAHLEELLELQRPLLVPVSRKTVIGDALGIEEPVRRDPGTVASMVVSALQGGHIFRVHNVPAAWQSLRVMEALAETNSTSRELVMD